MNENYSKILKHRINRIRRWQNIRDNVEKPLSSVHLSSEDSIILIEKVCPICELYQYCERTYIPTNNEKICYRKSGELRTVWITAMPRRRISAGDVFGNLTVVSRHESEDTKHVYWMCKCVCGNTTVVRGDHLLAGRVRSCGCLRRVKKRRCGGTNSYNYGEKTYSVSDDIDVIKPRMHSRLISVMSRPVHEFHSHVGSKVGEVIEVVDENNAVKKVYTTVVCDECGGIVRYNKHNLKECSECGLIYNG